MKLANRAWTMLVLVPAAVGLLSCNGGGGGSSSVYQIDLRYMTSLTAAQKAAFEAAATRIEGIVTIKPSSVSVPWNTDTRAACEVPSGQTLPASETVGGLVIFASVKDLGATSGILAMSGPCLVRSNSHLPLAGVMVFNSNYIGALSDANLRKTVLHEMLHTLGFGTMWGPTTVSGFGWDLLSGAGAPGSSFTGAQALAAAKGENAAPSAWATVPVEDCVVHPGTGDCGAGTQDAHWRWAVFNNELMTGWIATGAQPLSATTVASLQDIGYTVDLSKADAFTVPAVGAALSLEPGPSGFWLGDDVRRVPPLEVPEP